MLNKRDNPQLFYYVIREVAKTDSTVNPLLTVTLTDEQLSKVTRLDIRPTFFAESNLSSLAGIEKLPNLEHLSVQGMSAKDYYDRTWPLTRLGIQSPQMDAELKNFANMYDSCQIQPQDTELIKKLPKLKTLDLSNQRNITELDISQNPELINVNCSGATNLKKVVGLQELDCFNGHEPEFLDEMDFSFTECPMLGDIGNPDKLFTQAYDLSDLSKPRLHFHTATYAKLFLQAQETGSQFQSMLVEQEESAAQVVEWVETGLKSFRCSHNSRQMKIINDRISNIIRTVCADNPSSDFEKLSRWYRWISDNCVYDHDGLKKEEDKVGSKSSQQRNTSNMRSSFHTLWSRTGVCAGVANLFNYGATLMNFSAVPVYCRTSPLKPGENPLAVRPDHEASEMFTGDGTSLYFDSTWDLQKLFSANFALTKQEFFRTHGITIESEKSKESAYSYQVALTRMGCLSTQDPSMKKMIGTEVAR